MIISRTVVSYVVFKLYIPTLWLFTKWICTHCAYAFWKTDTMAEASGSGVQSSSTSTLADSYHVPTPFLIGVSGGTASGKVRSHRLVCGHVYPIVSRFLCRR